MKSTLMNDTLPGPRQKQAAGGLLSGIAAYTLWGLLPLYWKLLDTVPAIETLAHRMVWALLFVSAVLAGRRDWRWLWPTLRQRSVLLTYAIAAGLLSANWFIYIWAVNAGYVVEASLGYFINPLVNVLLGVVFLGERLRQGQMLAVILAALGVLYLTLNHGGLPWIALLLAFTFGLYGLIKKKSPLGATRGFALEVMVTFLPALAYLLTIEFLSGGAFGHSGFGTTLLLALTGGVTAVPLLLFGSAARRIPLSMIGFLQYIAPTLQFLLGVFVFKEPFPAARLIGFVVIWVALIIYSVEGLLAQWKMNSKNLSSF